MEKFKQYWNKTSWQWKNLLTLILTMAGLLVTFFLMWGALMAAMAWITVQVWSIIVVGIFGFGREITFLEGFVFYLVLIFISNLFRSDTKVIRKR
jgi:hypothetical protein